MPAWIILLALIAVGYIIITFAKHNQFHNDEKRRRELSQMRQRLYPTICPVEGWDLLYLQVYRERVRQRSMGAEWEHHNRDAKLIHEMRNEAIALDIEKRIDIHGNLMRESTGFDNEPTGNFLRRTRS